MIRIEDIKKGDILYAIDIHSDDPKVEEFKIKSILKKNILFCNSFLVLTLINKDGEIRYIKIDPEIYNLNRQQCYLNRYHIFHDKRCKYTYEEENKFEFLYEDEYIEYVISFERDYVLDHHIEYCEKMLALDERDVEDLKKSIEQQKQIIDKLHKL